MQTVMQKIYPIICGFSLEEPQCFDIYIVKTTYAISTYIYEIKFVRIFKGNPIDT